MLLRRPPFLWGAPLFEFLRRFPIWHIRSADLLAFARAAGLRRHELAAVKPKQIRRNANGNVTLCDVKGKGGKVRDSDVLPGTEAAVLKYAGNI